MEQLWTEKYRPKGSDDIIGHDGLLTELLAWIRGNAADNRVVYLWGPPGSGKTSLVHVVCNLAGYQVIEYNASSLRSTSALSQLEQDLKNASHSVETFFTGLKPTPVAALLDEVDGITHSDAQASLCKWLSKRKTGIPIFLTSNDCITKFRNAAQTHLVMPPPDKAIADFLKRVADQERLPDPQCDLIAARVRGDIRQGLVLLQFGHDIPVVPKPGAAKNPFGVLMHAKCPPDVLEKGARLCPFPKSLPYSPFPELPAGLPQRDLSALSQWGLWKARNRA